MSCEFLFGRPFSVLSYCGINLLEARVVSALFADVPPRPKQCLVCDRCQETLVVCVKSLSQTLPGHARSRPPAGSSGGHSPGPGVLGTTPRVKERSSPQAWTLTFGPDSSMHSLVLSSP